MNERNTIQKLYCGATICAGLVTAYLILVFLLEVGSNGTDVSNKFWLAVQGCVITGLLYFFQKP